MADFSTLWEAAMLLDKESAQTQLAQKQYFIVKPCNLL